MPDAFFQKKRKRTSPASSKGAGRGGSKAGPSSSSSRPSGGRMRRRETDEDEDEEGEDDGAGIDDMDLQHRYAEAINSDEEADAAETPAEARVRLAKMYLQGLKTGGRGDEEGDDFFESADLPDAAQADRENISARLQKDVAEQSGNIHLFIANRIALPEEFDYTQSMLAVRGHRLSVTAAVAAQDAKSFFTASKDGNLIRWRLCDGKMLRVFPKRPKYADPSATSRSVTTLKPNRSKTSGAARRRERMSKSSAPVADALAATKGKAKAPDTAPLTNGINGHTADSSTYLTLGANEGHTDEIWSLSISSDGKYLASAGKDRRICIWSLYDDTAAQESFVKALGGHKDSISAVCFRPGSQELYSASLDRTLKLFDVSQLSYIETLFGHQESILSLSCLRAETAVTAGGRDRTCRYWKIRDESQLVFRAGIKSRIREVLEGGDLARLQETADAAEGTASSRLLTNPNEAMEGSVECVSMIDAHHFLSGGDSGSIALWNLGKKKPIFSVPVAHGFEETESETEGRIRTPRWITALAALPYGDVFASGSWDGSVRVWGLTAGGPGGVRGFKQLFALDVAGVINSLQIVLPPLSTVVVPADDDDAGLINTLATRAEEWKRTHGLAQSLATPALSAEATHTWKKLPNIAGTKDNTPPILVVGVGQEHKFGRWIKQPNAKNGALVIPLRLKTHERMTAERALRKTQHLSNGYPLDEDE